MRNLLIATLSISLLTSSAMAADGALSPGQPAGIHKAQAHNDNTLFIVLGVAVVAAGIAIAASSGNSNTPPVAVISSSTGTGTP